MFTYNIWMILKMLDMLQDPLIGLLDGLISGAIAFFVVLLLAFFYRFFTNEKLPSFIGIAFGLGFWGFTGGLIDIFQQPTLGGVIRILTVLIFVVWGVNTGDKISNKIPQKGIDIIKGIRSQNKKFTKIKLPHQRLIFDIALKPKVPNSLKAELSEREFTLPADLPQEAIIKRVKRRLITDWGLGDAEIELSQDGKILHFSIAAKEEGLSVILPTGKIAIPIECKILPSNLTIGDFVTIFMENKQVIEKTEVKGIDEKKKVITIFSDPSILKKISNSKARLVIALPISVPKPPALSVEDESGIIEEFKTDTLLNSLIGVGLDRKAAREIVDRVQYKLCKLDPPVSKSVIKKAIIKELENENSETAKKFNKRRIWK
jgi:hypothetical protein